MVSPVRSRQHVHFIRAHLVCSVILGIVIVLFFKCVAALLDPANRRGERVKWGLVSYTAIMFSFVTLQTALALHAESICYIDDREFPGIEGAAPPGPLGYAGLINHKALTIVPNITFYLNGWLADGLLVSFLFDSALTRLGD